MNIEVFFPFFFLFALAILWGGESETLIVGEQVQLYWWKHYRIEWRKRTGGLKHLHLPSINSVDALDSILSSLFSLPVSGKAGDWGEHVRANAFPRRIPPAAPEVSGEVQGKLLESGKLGSAGGSPHGAQGWHLRVCRLGHHRFSSPRRCGGGLLTGGNLCCPVSCCLTSVRVSFSSLTKKEKQLFWRTCPLNQGTALA